MNGLLPNGPNDWEVTVLGGLQAPSELSAGITGTALRRWEAMTALLKQEVRRLEKAAEKALRGSG